MKRLISILVYISTGHLCASESDQSSMTEPIPVVLGSPYFSTHGSITPYSFRTSSPTDQHEIRLEMNEFEKSLATDALDHPTLTAPITGNARAAELLTQIAHGTTANKPTFLTKHLINELVKLEQNDPVKYHHLLNELSDHKTRTMHLVRSKRNMLIQTGHIEPSQMPHELADTPAAIGEALQNKTPASAIQLITAAASASHLELTSINDAQAVTLGQAKLKFWVVLIAGTITTLSVSAVAFIQALGVHA